MTNIIHIKLEYEEALEAKREILSSEIGLIKIVKIMKRYELLRNEELRLKTKLKRKSAEFNIEMRKLQRDLPEMQMPESIKRLEKEHNVPVKREKQERDLEFELHEIQDKLNSLQKR